MLKKALQNAKNGFVMPLLAKNGKITKNETVYSIDYLHIMIKRSSIIGIL